MQSLVAGFLRTHDDEDVYIYSGPPGMTRGLFRLPSTLVPGGSLWECVYVQTCDLPDGAVFVILARRDGPFSGGTCATLPEA